MSFFCYTLLPWLTCTHHVCMSPTRLYVFERRDHLILVTSNCVKPSGLLYYADEVCNHADKYKLENYIMTLWGIYYWFGTGLVQSFPRYEEMWKS